MKKSVLVAGCGIRTSLWSLDANSFGSGRLRQHIGHGNRSLRGGCGRRKGHGHESDQECCRLKPRRTRVGTTRLRI